MQKPHNCKQHQNKKRTCVFLKLFYHIFYIARICRNLVKSVKKTSACICFTKYLFLKVLQNSVEKVSRLESLLIK